MKMSAEGHVFTYSASMAVRKLHLMDLYIQCTTSVQTVELKINSEKWVALVRRNYG